MSQIPDVFFCYTDTSDWSRKYHSDILGIQAAMRASAIPSLFQEYALELWSSVWDYPMECKGCNTVYQYLELRYDRTKIKLQSCPCEREQPNCKSGCYFSTMDSNMDLLTVIFSYLCPTGITWLSIYGESLILPQISGYGRWHSRICSPSIPGLYILESTIKSAVCILSKTKSYW